MGFEITHLQADGGVGVGLERFPDTQGFLHVLEKLHDPPPADAQETPDWAAARALFLPAGGGGGSDIYVARAPGRLDVMGGIADYSGSLVLQMPLAEACHVAVQRQAGAPGAAPPRLRVVSFSRQGSRRSPDFEVALGALMPGGQPISYEAARALFRADASRAWAAYVAGAVVVLQRERGARFADSLSILVASDVPEGKGVSSSAALEVAAMSALAAAHGIALEGRDLALLCQRVENAVVGAPCGVMDQMTAALGEEGRLLALRCQPAEVLGSTPIPPHLQFWGVDSGKAHSVGGSDYAHVRAGAFMGLRICSQLAHEAAGGSGSNGEVPRIGYLANLRPGEFVQRYEQQLPEALSGADFLQRYGPHWDHATSVSPEQVYAVRTPTAHPVHENFRVQAFQQVLAAPGGPEQLQVLGELMQQSHSSYSRCGLGSDGTDQLVALVQEEHDAAAAGGQPPALYGAKITGGGCGGTVGILAVAGERGVAAVRRVVQRYTEESGHTPKVFSGFSSGAAAFGHLRLRRSGTAAGTAAGAAAS